MHPVEAMKVFQRVAESGSFSRAAEQLSMPRATVSMAVRLLEAHLGTRLLHRTTRRVSLTADGRECLARSTALLAALQDMEGQFRPTGAPLQGILRADLPVGILRDLVMPALPAFLDAHPGLVLELSGSDRRTAVVREGFDCVLRIGQPDDPQLVARPLGRLPMCHCASRDYLERHGLPDTPAALAGHTRIGYAPNPGDTSAPFDLPDGSFAPPMACRITVGDSVAYLAAGRAGLGLIQVPRLAVADLLASGELVEVLPDFPPPAMPVTLLYAQRQHVPQRTRVFMDWLADCLVPHLAP